MSDRPLQPSLFEEDYPLRKLGVVAHVPQVALIPATLERVFSGAH
jgi:hypothetical protein